MPNATQIAALRRPESQALRAHNSKFIAMITRKAYDWGLANGYGDLLIAVDHFMEAYKAAQTPADWYSGQTPEQLIEMIAKSQKRMNKAMQALAAKERA